MVDIRIVYIIMFLESLIKPTKTIAIYKKIGYNTVYKLIAIIYAFIVKWI